MGESVRDADLVRIQGGLDEEEVFGGKLLESFVE
jgi:hypothetical protein